MEPRARIALADAPGGAAPSDSAGTAYLPRPGTALHEVLAAYEALGHAGPGTAWAAFTSGFHWAAPLPAAEPVDGDPSAAPRARASCGGHLLSGTWRLAPSAPSARWVALPAPAERGRPVFAVRRAQGAEDAEGFRLRDLFVPSGLTSSAEGTPLRSADAPYAWVAAMGMAYGSSRLLLAEQTGRPGPPEATVPHLAALLERERDAVHAGLRDARVPAVGDERLEERAERTAQLVREVYAACCAEGPDALLPRQESPLTAGAPLLQFLRFAAELLPCR